MDYTPSRLCSSSSSITCSSVSLYGWVRTCDRRWCRRDCCGCVVDLWWTELLPTLAPPLTDRGFDVMLDDRENNRAIRASRSRWSSSYATDRYSSILTHIRLVGTEFTWQAQEPSRDRHRDFHMTGTGAFTWQA